MACGRDCTWDRPGGCVHKAAGKGRVDRGVCAARWRPSHPQACRPPAPTVVRTVQSVCLGSALTASRRTCGTSRMVQTPSSVGRAEGASLPRCLCPCDLPHRGSYLRSSGACARLPALSLCASAPAAAGREAAGAQSRAPAAWSVVTAASPSCKEARTGGARMLCGQLTVWGHPEENCKI